jgi:hypothetical protein
MHGPTGLWTDRVLYSTDGLVWVMFSLPQQPQASGNRLSLLNRGLLYNWYLFYQAGVAIRTPPPSIAGV